MLFYKVWLEFLILPKIPGKKKTKPRLSAHRVSSKRLLNLVMLNTVTTSGECPHLWVKLNLKREIPLSPPWYRYFSKFIAPVIPQSSDSLEWLPVRSGCFFAPSHGHGRSPACFTLHFSPCWIGPEIARSPRNLPKNGRKSPGGGGSRSGQSVSLPAWLNLGENSYGQHPVSYYHTFDIVGKFLLISKPNLWP